MTPLDVIGKLARGDEYVVNVTFPEGQTIEEMGDIFASHGYGPASAFVDAANDVSLIRALDPAAQNLEGYLFPDTYPLPRRADAPRLIRAMVQGFERVLTPALRSAVEARGLSIHQAVTLASIVEKESARNDERPMVAGVYLNRFRIGMALQCDPTIIYALKRAGTGYQGNLRQRRPPAFPDSAASNTYPVRGAAPRSHRLAGQGLRWKPRSIPPTFEYRYFVSRNDGSHVFARTLDEHNRNVQKYQVQYFRDLRAAGK